jgi:cellulose biosynthesis protein BcsQ
VKNSTLNKALVPAVQMPTVRIHPAGKRAIILTIGCAKGGVGKTTTALMLALSYVLTLGLRVLVVDADPKHSAAWYWNARVQKRVADGIDVCGMPFHVEELSARSYLADKIKARGWLDDYDLIIVDTGGDDDGILVDAAAMSDHILLTVSPSEMDLDGLRSTKRAVDQGLAKGNSRPPRVLLTQCIVSSRGDLNAKDILRGSGIDVLTTTVPLLTWYRNTYGKLPVYRDRITARHYAAVQHELTNS